MRKRLVFKVAVMAAALSAVTLLSGCDGEEDGLVFRFAWMPVMPGVTFGTAGVAMSQGSAGGGAQGTGGGAGGATAGAVASGSGGGGGQVSSGGVQ